MIFLIVAYNAMPKAADTANPIIRLRNFLSKVGSPMFRVSEASLAYGEKVAITLF